MTIGLTPNSSEQEKIDALNYAVATASGYGNTQVAAYLPNDPTIDNINDNALFMNPNTGDIAATVAGQPFARYYQYVHFAYANSSDGSTDFSTTVYTNKYYYGVRNTDSTTESTNPTDYVWYEVSGGFGTTNRLFYLTYGQQVSITVATSAPNGFYRPAEDVAYVNIQEISQAYIPPEYITATELLDDTITDAKLALATITGASIAPATLTGSLIANDTITGASIAPATLTGDLVENSTITGSLIANDTITGSLIANSTITGDLVANSTITGSLIANDTITGSLIANSTITGSLIANDTITGNLVATNTISADSIVANSITGAQLQVGLLISGDVVSFNGTLGDTDSDGFWLDYSTGDARFAGNTSIGGNVDIEGLLTAGDIISGSIDTTAIANNAVSQTVDTYIEQAGLLTNTDYTRYMELPKLKGWRGFYTDADEMTVVLAATIVPSSSDSIIEVSYNVFYDNSTGSDYGSVALFRSQHEGVLNAGSGGKEYAPTMEYNFRNIDILYSDEQSTQNSLTNSAFVVSGYENIATTFNNRTSNSNATVSTFSLSPATQGTSGSIADSVATSNSYPVSGLASWASDLSDIHRKKYMPILGYENNGTGYFSFPSDELPNFGNNITTTVKTPFADSGQTNAHGMLVGTDLTYDAATDSDIATIYQTASLDGNVYAATEVSTTVGAFRKMASNIPPWTTGDYYPNVCAVGDNALVYFNYSRFYGTDGVFDFHNGWYQDDVYVNSGNTFDYTGNLYGVCASENSSDWMSINSTHSAGGGKDSFATNSGLWVAVGEHGAIFQRGTFTGSGYWTRCAGTPPNLAGITLRAVCYDHYRYRWWAVGDAGTILYANDRSDDTLLWNVYNSGTTRNLYDIIWDPISLNWAAVGDGIVIVDDGQTKVSGQRVYPNSTYAFDACAGLYTTYPPLNATLAYEPQPTINHKGFNQNGYYYNGFTQFDDNAQTATAIWQYNGSKTIQLHRGSVISAVYTENTNSQTNRLSGHFEGVPITFYLMAGAPSGTNVVVGASNMVITEIKR